MLGHNNIRIEELTAENRRLTAELDAAIARSNALRTLLCQAWREHGVLPGQLGDGGTVTAESAMQRLCWN